VRAGAQKATKTSQGAQRQKFGVAKTNREDRDSKHKKKKVSVSSSQDQISPIRRRQFDTGKVIDNFLLHAHLHTYKQKHLSQAIILGESLPKQKQTNLLLFKIGSL